MTRDLLESSAVSAFCGSLATMLAAGIQHDEAVMMLADERGESLFGDVCADMHAVIVEGGSLAEAMRACGAFDAYAVEMVGAAEEAGRLEQALRSLETYYDEQDAMFEKLRSATAYPAAMLTIMTAILVVTVLVVLPIFGDVYENVAVAPGAGTAIAASRAIGWAALVVCALAAAAAIALTIACRTEAGRARVARLLERLPLLRGAMYQMALSRFTSVLGTRVSAGMHEDEALRLAAETVEHPLLASRVSSAYEAMVDLDDPRALSQALGESGAVEPLYARLLNVGMRSGSADDTLGRMSKTFFDDAVLQIDVALDRIEPALAAFMTVAVGATLIAAMLPLLGIMASLG